MASIFDVFGGGKGIPGVIGGIRNTVAQPMFLAGAGLMSGGGWGGAMQGASLGQGILNQDRAEGERQRLSDYWNKNSGSVDGKTRMALEALPLERRGEFFAQAIEAEKRRQAEEAHRARENQFEREKWSTQKGLIEAQTASAHAMANKREMDFSDPRVRAAMASQYGLDPNSDAGRAFILTGKLPREDQQALTATDKKAIIEADELASANRSVIDAIGKAEELSPKSYEGALASQRAWAANNFLPWDTPEAEATVNLDNAVTQQALAQLKTIFGGNPTEGERKILLDLQGASNQPQAVRAEIFKRAKAAADVRLKFNEERATALRGGTYYKPQGAPGTTEPAPSGMGGAPIRARNPQTGQTIEWNGKEWVPVQ